MNSTACSALLSRWDRRFTRFLRALDDDSQIMAVLISDVLGDPSLISHSTVTPFPPKESSSLTPALHHFALLQAQTFVVYPTDSV